jgi:hypothetical protein
LDGLRSLTLRLSWIFFLFASTLSLPLVAALAGGTAGTTANAVAYMVSVRSPIADFRMRFSRGKWSKLVPCLIVRSAGIIVTARSFSRNRERTLAVQHDDLASRWRNPAYDA